MAHATAKTHVSRLLTKLDCRDRAQLVMVAYEAGIATPGGAGAGDAVAPGAAHRRSDPTGAAPRSTGTHAARHGARSSAG